MKKKSMSALSPNFRKKYRKFLKGEISLLELRSSIEITGDIIFFQKECNTQSILNISALVPNIVNKFIDNLLSEMEKSLDSYGKKSAILKVLLVFLGNYSCFANDSIREGCKNITLHFVTGNKDIRENDRINDLIHEMISFITSNMVENEESVLRIIVFRLLCLYAILAISDKEGANQCAQLAEKLSCDWRKGRAEEVTLLSVGRVKKSESPVIALGKFLF